MWILEKTGEMLGNAVEFVQDEAAEVSNKRSQGKSGAASIICIALWMVPFLGFAAVLINDIVGAITNPGVFFGVFTDSETYGWPFVPANMFGENATRQVALKPWVLTTYAIFCAFVLLSGLLILLKRGHKVRFTFGLLLSVLSVAGLPLGILYYLGTNDNKVSDWQSYVSYLRQTYAEASRADIELFLWIFLSIALLLMALICLGSGLSVFFVFALSANVYLCAGVAVLAILLAVVFLVSVIINAFASLGGSSKTSGQTSVGGIQAPGFESRRSEAVPDRQKANQPRADADQAIIRELDEQYCREFKVITNMSPNELDWKILKDGTKREAVKALRQRMQAEARKKGVEGRTYWF